jgi:hypothetical protein
MNQLVETVRRIINDKSMSPQGWLWPEQYDQAIVGVCHVDASGIVAAYNFDIFVTLVSSLKEMRQDEAALWFYDNVLYSITVGDPVYVSHPISMDDGKIITMAPPLY